MKPRTKLEKHSVALAGKLPPLTDAQRRYAISLFPQVGYYLKKGEVWCQCCGYIDTVSKPMLAVSLEMESHICPNCGKSLNLEHRHGRKANSEEKLYSVVQSFRGMMVVRTFDVLRDNVYGCDTRMYIHEVFQNWITDDGKEVITGKKYTRSPFHFSWDYDSKTDVKQHNGSASGSYEMNDVFDVTGNFLYPRASVTSLLRRNGWTNRILRLPRVSVVNAICQLLTNPLAETLVKTGQLSVFEYMLRKDNYEIPFRHALNICNRNHYIVQDASLWFDYLEALAYFNLDTHNAKYVCPPNLMEAHDKMMERKRKVKAKRSLEEKCKEAAKWEEVYKKDKGKFFGVCFGDGEIMVTVISSVAEIAEEGAAMHHCVYDNGYYKRPDSLILSAKDTEGKRIETVELNLKTLKVEQSRAVCNGVSPYHNRIIGLVEKNINLIKQRMTA